MKNIIFLLIVLAIPTFSQSTKIEGQIPRDYNREPASVLYIYSETDSSFYPLVRDASGNLKVTVSGVSISADSLFIKPPTGLASGTKSVTTSASLLASSADAQEVWIINDNESGIIYFGGSGVTTSNGVPIYPKMSAVVRTDNIADVYVIAASALTARYLKVN